MTMRPVESPAAPSGRARLDPWIWAFVAAAPFLSVNVMHATCRAGEPTGFMGYDQPYYVANGRAIFERGNGLAYPNPFDPAADAPAIYFHWLIWLIGFAVARCGIDPGHLIVVVHGMAAIATARLTWALVRRCLPSPCGQIPLFLFSVWGGGVFVLANLLANPSLVHHSWSDLLRPDPSDGWWFLNWGRNLVYPLESVYHALMCATWLLVLNRRWWATLCTAGLLALTHPFSGFQVLAILVAWSVLSRLTSLARGPDSPRIVPTWFLVATVAACAAFLSYNLLYLGDFAQHRRLQAEWSIAWTLDWPAIWRAYLLVAGVAGTRLALRRFPRDWSVAFLATCFAVSFLLANHEWFVAPRQPLHFTRGYIWMPLCLIGLPVLQAGWEMVVTSRRRLVTSIPVVLLAAVTMADNAVFVAQYSALRAEYGFFLSDMERDLFRALEAQPRRGVLLVPDARLGYLTAVYTSWRPYFGHVHNTPDFATRQRQAHEFYRTGVDLPWMESIDAIVLRRRQPQPDSWREIVSNREWVVVERASSDR